MIVAIAAATNGWEDWKWDICAPTFAEHKMRVIVCLFVRTFVSLLV